MTQFYTRLNSCRYLVELDENRTLLYAWVEIKAHDKAPTMRKVTNKITLEKLQEQLLPKTPCPSCGQLCPNP